MAPHISVIIVNYNSGARLRRCVDCLKAQDFRDFETIVIDNASSDGSAAFARDDGAVTLIEAGGNLGFAAGNNLAAKSAQGEWLAFLNPDAYAEPDWLSEFLAAAARHPEIDAFGSTQLDAARPDRIDGAGDAYHAFGVSWRGCYAWPKDKLPPEGECFAPCGAAAFYRKATFDRLGGFEERFFCYAEDADLGFKLRLSGGGAMQAPKAVVLHEGSGVTGKESDFTLYHGHRNRVWTYVLNMPLPLLVLTAPFHLLLNLYLLGRFTVSGGAGSYLRAMKDAAKGLPEIWERRKARQRAREASVADIARALTWSPLKMMRREADIRTRLKTR
ncbi:glycosyltransferase family 2 protein [Hyphococcus luteus]|uniref:Glycosyltransferase family 2 protein n=1 Tax=Hyphococcus luteus TaxID=2058213 RepID=A0A2S7K7S5_9PROT|nr:glycosyltransferase family 2 protein [Marinicaulis flavus]PQA88543.1 glycosyltransferase family 2 protein [Marinicaulis flavus]